MASLTFFVPSTRLDSKGRLLPLPGRNELENTARTNRQKAGKEKKRHIRSGFPYVGKNCRCHCSACGKKHLLRCSDQADIGKYLRDNTA